MAEVVVGVDGSGAGALALRVALQEAALRHAELRVLHSWRTPPVAGMVPGIGYDVSDLVLEDRSAWASDLLDDAVAQARTAGGPDVAGVHVVKDVRAGDAGTDLVLASKGADLLVLGARRHGALTSALVGSATNYVLHRAQCPVLVVPANPGDGHRWRRVVVGVDGSEGSDEALRWAAAEALRHGCPLLAVHAWLLRTNPEWLGSTSTTDADYARGVEEWLTAHVDTVLGGHPDLVLEVRAVESTAAAAVIGACGPEDLLVVGTRGRSALADLLLGSVAMQCAHHARSAVTLVRAAPGSQP